MAGIEEIRKYSIYIGYDPREAAAYAVCRNSIRRHISARIRCTSLDLDDLRSKGLYWRQTERRIRQDLNGRTLSSQLWDVISGAPMSTEFAITRFFVPHLAETGFAIFMDCDIMARVDIMQIFALADPTKAVQCVKHLHEPSVGIKMDGQQQTKYSRKNWSSVMLFNCDHPSNKRLTPELINTLPGRDLHAFCWLEHDEIGELPARYNFLVGHTKLPENEEPALIHWTDGAPCLPGYENAPYADEFWRELRNWAT